MKNEKLKIKKRRTPLAYRWRFATLMRDLPAKFSKWPGGLRVKAIHCGRNIFLIERVKWKGKLPLINQCANVPGNWLALLGFVPDEEIRK